MLGLWNKEGTGDERSPEKKIEAHRSKFFLFNINFLWLTYLIFIEYLLCVRPWGRYRSTAVNKTIGSMLSMTSQSGRWDRPVKTWFCIVPSTVIKAWDSAQRKESIRVCTVLYSLQSTFSPMISLDLHNNPLSFSEQRLVFSFYAWKKWG